MRRGKEVHSLRDLEYYKQKSPLLNTFLDRQLSKDRSIWIGSLNNHIDDTHILEFAEKFGTDWSDAVNALTLMVWSFGLQERNVDSSFAMDTTRSLLYIGYELGEIGGVDVVLPKVCEQLKSVNYIHSEWFKKSNTKIIAQNVIRGIVRTGAYYKLSLYDENDKLAPFSEFVRGLKF